MNVMDEYVDIKGSKIHYVTNVRENGGDAVLLLHGKRFTTRDWVESGLMETLERQGVQAIALEMPGYGESEELDLDPEDFLAEFMKRMNLSAVHIVGPSFSGEISIRFALKFPDMLKSMIIIDSINVDKYEDKLKDIKVKTLIVWGKKDNIAPYEFAEILKDHLPESTLFTFEDLGHTCYFDDMPTFSDVLIKFINEN
ncbi:MAG TPA: alpha/beta fold hydrolase [Thermoanaerobacterales bacterium]|nr:alpha/beta fold hydrolase [Thermoanaerobacterales bacterium]